MNVRKVSIVVIATPRATIRMDLISVLVNKDIREMERKTAMVSISLHPLSVVVGSLNRQTVLPNLSYFFIV